MTTTVSKTPPDLPADVWLYIFQRINHEYDEFDKYAIIPPASVNKFLRSINLTVLFRTLSLSTPESIKLTTFSLKKIIQRVRDIRQLTLVHWYIYPCDDDVPDGTIESDDYFMDEPDINLVDCRENHHEIFEFKLDGHREIIVLISHFPGLEHLVCHHCSFTLESLTRIFAIPNLQLLHVRDHSTIHGDSTKYPVAVANSSPRAFQYTLGR